MSFWLIYIVATFTVSTVLVVVGWRSRLTATPDNNWYHHLPSQTVVPSDAVSHSESIGDASEAIAAALHRQQCTIRERQIRIIVAAEPGLLVRMRPKSLIDMISELLSAGLNIVPGGRLLLTARRLGERIEITLSDDEASGDGDALRTQSRVLAERASLLGGSLEIASAASRGTSMTLRLGAALPRSADTVVTKSIDALSDIPERAVHQLL